MPTNRHTLPEDALAPAPCTCAQDPVIAYDIADAAARVGLSARTLRDAVLSGDLVAHYYGRKPLFGRDDLAAWFHRLPTSP